MATWEIDTQNGKIEVTTPDNVTPEAFNAYVSANHQTIADAAQGKPKKEPATSVFKRILYGLQEPLSAAAQMLERSVPEGVANYVNKMDNILYDATNGVLGQPQESFSQRLAEENAAYKGPEGIDWARMGGNIAGLPVPGAAVATLPRMAATGAVAGTMAPVYDPNASFIGEKALQAGTGAALGGALGAASRVIAPRMGSAEGLDVMKEAGIPVTAGQAIGGKLKGLEEAAKNMPLIGGTIQKRRNQSVEAFNKESINRVMRDIGANPIDDVGINAIDKAKAKISPAYQSSFRLINTKWDEIKEGAGFGRTNSITSSMNDDVVNKFKDVVQDIMDSAKDKFDAPASMAKAANANLLKTADKYRKSGTVDDLHIAEALDAYQIDLMRHIGRQNKEFAKEFGKINRANERLDIIRTAADSAESGIFPPGSLLSSISRATEQDLAQSPTKLPMKSIDKDWATAGDAVLGRAGMGKEGGMRAAIGSGAALMEPMTLLIAAVGSAAYQPWAQKALIWHLQSGKSTGAAVDAVVKQLGSGSIPAINREMK